MEAREAAFICLNKIIGKKGYSNLVLDNFLSKNSMGSLEKTLCTKLVYGVISNMLLLDYNIQKLTRRTSMQVQNIMRIALYQMWLLDKIPAHAACNQSVELAKKYAKGTEKLVNAVLRNAPVQPVLPPETKKCQYLSVKYSFPDWLVGRFLKEMGTQQTEQLLQAFLAPPKMVIRPNPLKQNTTVEGKPHPIVQGALTVETYSRDEFKAGAFAIEDAGSQYAINLLSPNSQDTVLDMCAAPGGKTAHMAALMQNKGSILACDLTDNRISLIKEGLKRLGVKNAKTMQWDAKIFNSDFEQSFDKVLLDAPCTGLGVVRRKPEIKWTKTYEDIKALSKETAVMLRNGAQYVKPGGRLLFSTCTITHEENQDCITEFLEENREFKLLTMQTLYPHTHQTDGFFVALMEREW